MRNFPQNAALVEFSMQPDDCTAELGGNFENASLSSTTTEIELIISLVWLQAENLRYDADEIGFSNVARR